MSMGSIGAVAWGLHRHRGRDYPPYPSRSDVGAATTTARRDADGTWRVFKAFDVAAGETMKFEFPAGYAAHWVRARSYTTCKATVQFSYD